MRNKGMSGKILGFIISLVIAVMALIFLWMFLTSSTELINDGVQKIISGFKCKILCREILGMKIGMCSGC